MKLTILGTGNATVTECYNTCFALSDGNRHFLVDTGGGNRILKVLKDTGIQLEDIHDIFITHEHIDHLLGVIWLIRMIGQKKIGQGKYEGNLRIYCHEELARSIRKIAELTIQKKVTKYFDAGASRRDKGNPWLSGHLFRYFFHEGKAVRVYDAASERSEAYLLR